VVVLVCVAVLVTVGVCDAVLVTVDYGVWVGVCVLVLV